MLPPVAIDPLAAALPAAAPGHEVQAVPGADAGATAEPAPLPGTPLEPAAPAPIPVEAAAPLPLGTIGVWKVDANAAAKIAASLAAQGISNVPVKGARFPGIVCSPPDAAGQYQLQIFGIPSSTVAAIAAVGDGEGQFRPNA